MEKVAAIDCGPEVVAAVQEMLGREVALSSVSFGDIQSLQEYRMVVIEGGGDPEDVNRRIRKLRYACYFRKVPIILIVRRGMVDAIEPYISSGATDVLSLEEPLAAIRQILKSHLIPNRDPLKEELEYLNTFIKNTTHVLEKTAGVKASFKEVYFTNAFRIFGDISGIIGLSGRAEGLLAITFYWPLAKRIISKMMLVDEDHINVDLIHDGVAEIINMISGSTKKDFVGKPYHFEISLPSVIVGSGHQIGHAENTPIAIMIFEVDFHYFALQLCIKPKAERDGDRAGRQK